MTFFIKVVRDGRRFKILVEGRFHHPSEPWVYDVTATDTRTQTSKRIKHFNRKEDGVEETVRAVMAAMREQGLLDVVENEAREAVTRETVSRQQTNASNDHRTSRFILDNFFPKK